MTPALPTVAFVIPVRNDAARLGRCLASIRANVYEGRIEIVVLDNGSTDGSADVARAAGADVLEMPGAAVAELRNAGAARTTGEILAFVDADHVIDRTWIAAAVACLADATVGAAGAPYAPPPGATWVQRAYDRLRSHRPEHREVNWLGSGNLAVRRDVFIGLGGFDSSLQTCEDVDFCARVRTAGWRLIASEQLRSVHYGDPATLSALFTGELWRGRNNLTVFLRGPVTLRSIPSVAIPVIDSMCIAVALYGVVTIAGTGWRLLMMGGAAFSALSALRSLRMNQEAARLDAGTASANFVVACVYDLARCLALFARADHGLRRGEARK